MRYYFHIHIENGGSEVDDVGCDFSSEALAITEARRLAEELTLESVKVGSKLRHTIEVADESGRQVIRLDGQAEIKETGPR
jgi:hypothetical protein